MNNMIYSIHKIIKIYILNLYKPNESFRIIKGKIKNKTKG